MSEVSDIFDFREESDGLDIDAIFGETDGALDPLPMAEEQKPKEQTDAGSTAPQTAEEENVTVEETARSNGGGETEAEQDLFSVFAEEKEAGKQPQPPAIMDVSAEKSLSLFRLNSCSCSKSLTSCQGYSTSPYMSLSSLRASSTMSGGRKKELFSMAQ